MNIVLGLHSLQLGGSQINTVDLGAGLRDRGHNVALFAIDNGLRYRSTITPVAEQSGFRVYSLPGERSIIRQARHVTNLVDRLDADVLHVNHEGHMIGPIGAFALRSRARPSLVITNWIMEVSLWLPRHSPLIVGTANLQRQAARSQRGPVWLLEPPVNIARDRVATRDVAELRSTLGLRSEDLMCGLVTRVDRSLKLDSITLAMRMVEELDIPRLRLVIVGDGDAYTEVSTVARRVNARLDRDAIVLTGAMPDPRPAYAASDIVLAMGGSALRGMAFGKPVIVLGEGGFSRTVSPWTMDYFFDHGFYGAIAPDIPTSLGEDVVALLDPSARRQLGDFGKRIVHERYSLDAAVSTLEDVYVRSREHPPSPIHRWSDVAFLTAGYLALSVAPTNMYARVRRPLREMVLRHGYSESDRRTASYVWGGRMGAGAKVTKAKTSNEPPK